MRVSFLGTSAFAVPSLERLVSAGHEVGVCVTPPDRPSGRGLRPAASPVKEAAQRLGLTLAQPERLTPELLSASRPELGVAVAYGRLVPQAVLEVPRHGMVGLHPSLLPAYRGAAPVAWALLNGETATGVTIFRMTDRLDAGEILLQRRVEIAADDDAETLASRLASLGAEALLEAIEAIASGRARAAPQEEAKATLAPKLTKADGRLRWREPAEALARRIRATAPWPGASTAWEGRALKIWRAQADAAAPTTAPPGTVVSAGVNGIVVATGRGTLTLHELQPAGRRRMRAEEFLAGHALRAGAQFEG